MQTSTSEIYVKRTNYNTVFVDTAPFIYYLEKNPQYFKKTKAFFDNCQKSKIKLVTSTITLEEYCVYPYMNNQPEYINNFERFIQFLGIKMYDIDKNTAKHASKIRAQFKDFKAMDAIQIATAVVHNCDLFLTNDKQLCQFQKIPCITLNAL